MYDKIRPLKASNDWRENPISAVRQGFEFTFVFIIFAKLILICLVNLINIFHHIPVLRAVKFT